MGTRALVNVMDEDKKILVTIYRQFDGYPEGLGAELRKMARGTKLVNGFGFGEAIPEAFNGIGCFAAWLVGNLKGDNIGNVYIMAPGTKDVGEEYVYTVRPTKNGKIQVICKEV